MREDGWGIGRRVEGVEAWLGAREVGEGEGGEGWGMMDEGVGVRGERWSVKEEGSGNGSDLGFYLDLDPDPDP